MATATARFSAGTEGKPSWPGHGAVPLHHVHQPGRAGVVQEELGVLAGEVLMVQVQPVVGLELGAEHLRVPHLLELDAGVVERHRDRVVPRRGVGRRVDRHLRRLLQRHGVHVAALDLAPDLAPAAPSSSGSVVMPLSAASRVAAASAGQQERSAAVVEKPLGPSAALEQAEGQAVGLEVIRLGVVHRHQQPRRRSSADAGARTAGESASSPAAPRERKSRRFMSAAPRRGPRPGGGGPGGPARWTGR